MQRAAGPVLLRKHLERYGPRHADVNPSRRVHCDTPATLFIVPLERDGEGNSCRVGVATGQPRGGVDVSRNVSVCARVSHNNYY